MIRLLIPDPDFLPIPDPGSRGPKGTGSRIRIRNTDLPSTPNTFNRLWTRIETFSFKEDTAPEIRTAPGTVPPVKKFLYYRTMRKLSK
jgi:hypothetical protein